MKAEDTQHSIVGASSSDRWMACPGSVNLIRKFPNVPSSIYAKEGKAAHALCESVLRGECDAFDMIGRHIEAEGHTFEVTNEMAESVATYAETVYYYCDADPDSKLWVERKFRLPQVDEECFGTADAVVWQPKFKRLVVIDFKYGAGIPVSPQDNSQLKYYGLGALFSFKDIRPEQVELVIVQPRCVQNAGDVQAWGIETIDLLGFAVSLKKAVAATRIPDAPLHAGEHCRWCPVAADCPELKRFSLQKAVKDFTEVGGAEMQDPETMTPDEIGALLERVTVWKRYIKQVEERAYQMACEGTPPTGFKLVYKRATRKWRDEDEALAALRSQGFQDEDIMDMKLLSPAALEKTLGRGFKETMAELVVSESSGTTLASISDNRKSVKSSAASEFTPTEETL